MKIDISNPILDLQGSDWKSSSITSSAVILIIVSMLSFFERITCSSSLSLVRRNKIDCYCEFNFPCIRLSEIHRQV